MNFLQFFVKLLLLYEPAGGAVVVEWSFSSTPKEHHDVHNTSNSHTGVSRDDFPYPVPNPGQNNHHALSLLLWSVTSCTKLCVDFQLVSTKRYS